jgi:hypothetical protein
VKKWMMFVAFILVHFCGVGQAQNFRVVDDPKSIQEVTLTCTRIYESTGPIGKYPELVGYAPVPPVCAGQKDVSLRVEVDGAASYKSTEVNELSPWHRLFNKVVIHPDQARSKITIKWIYKVKLTAQKLVRSVSRLSSTETDQPVISNPNPLLIDLEPGALKAFAEQRGLVRGRNESPVDFEWRSLQSLPHQLTYQHANNQSYKLSVLSKMSSPIPTDCGGFALLSVAVATANNISSRVRIGHLVTNDSNNTGSHMEYEFYDPYSKGYWIVEPTGSRNASLADLPNFFGIWPNNFITVMIGSDALVDTVHFGNQLIPWGAPSVWIFDCNYSFGQSEEWTDIFVPVPDEKSNSQKTASK